MTSPHWAVHLLVPRTQHNPHGRFSARQVIYHDISRCLFREHNVYFAWNDHQGKTLGDPWAFAEIWEWLPTIRVHVDADYCSGNNGRACFASLWAWAYSGTASVGLARIVIYHGEMSNDALAWIELMMDSWTKYIVLCQAGHMFQSSWTGCIERNWPWIHD